MTWLVGTSTWGNIVNDICKLACAEITDSLGHSPTTAEKWVRDIDTGHNLLRMPPSKDVDLAAVHPPAMRAGYWTLYSSPTGTGGANPTPPPPGTQAAQSVCKQTAPFTTVAPPSGQGRIMVLLECNRANTNANDYSTASFQALFYDADNDANQNGWFGGLTPSSAGVITLSSFGWTTGTAQVQVSDPSGFIQPGTYWFRGYTNTYLWGIDCWPLYARASGAWTFTTPPPGAAGTDYDIINQAPSGNNAAGVAGLAGSQLSGLGIKTAAGATGARYVFASCPATPLKVGLVNSGNAGSIDLLAFGVANDTVNGNLLRICGGNYIGQWLRLASTPASVTAAMTVQYWMSVTATGIVIVLNSDPGLTGGMTDGYFGLFTPGSAYDANDKFQNFVSGSIGGAWDSEGPRYGLTGQSYFRQYRCQDGSHGARDWQTYWMRSDFGNSGIVYYGLGGTALNYGNYYAAAGSYGDQIQGSPYDTAKPGYDGNWWLYGHRLVEGTTSITNGGLNPASEALGFPRGAVNDRFWHLPGIGWANGDELTDTSTGTKYLCVMPDAPGLPGRMPYSFGASGFRGGTAIAEI